MKIFTKIPMLLIAILLFSCSDNTANKKIADNELTPEEIYKERTEKKRQKKLQGKHKFKGPDELAVYQQGLRTSVNEKEPGYSTNYKMEAIQKALVSNNTRRESLNWIERGPTNVPGRTRAIVPIGDNFNTWLAGSVAGGVWKTENRGLGWELLTKDWPNMSATTIVRSQSNTDIFYVGTGEQYAGQNSVRGDGIFKSTDGGTTWTQLTSTTLNDNFRNINRLVVSPTDPDVVVAVTSLGYWEIDATTISKIMRSTDGGATWTEVYSSSNHIEHIVAAPSDFNIQYASINSVGVVKSIDAGVTWTDVSNGLVVDGRTELAVSPSNPQKVYASSESDIISSGSVLYVSVDGGSNWNLTLEENGGSNIDLLGGQGFYDNTILVHPFDDDIVYVGGVNLFKLEVSDQPAGSLSTLLGAEEDGTDAFMDYVNFTDADFNNGSVVIELNEGTNIISDDFVAVELRFGPGKSQKAHRFKVTPGTTSGFPLADYIYGDYTDVPFEVWDITNNKQLMVSYRDQEDNGVYNLNAFEAGGDNAASREYLFIHAIDYDASNPAPSIGQLGGVSDKMMYFMWPVLAEGGVWSNDNLPESKLVINWGEIQAKERASQVIADAYGNFAPVGQSVLNNSSVIHPDHHNIYPQIINESSETFRLLVTNDGGVYYSNTSTTPGETQGSWTFAGSGYNTTQFYGVDRSPVAEVYIGGTQDNGTWRSPLNAPGGANAWSFQLGGDGFEVVWNKGENDREMLGSIYWNQINKSTSNGVQWSSATSGLSDVGNGRGPFVTKLSNSPKRPDQVFAVGGSGVWRSTDFADSWQLGAIDDVDWFNSSFMDVEVSLSNPDYVMAGTGMSSRHGLFVSTDAGVTFTKVPNFSQDLGVLSGLHSHPTEDSTFYALFSFNRMSKVFRTKDLGQTWVDISQYSSGASQNGFPDVAAYCLLVREDSTDILWVGTDIGIVESRDNGETWALADNGLERVSIWDMKYWEGEVVVGTHGRGVFTADVLGGNVSVQDLFAQNSTIKVYPNPVSNNATLSGSFFKQPKSGELNIYSYLGFKVRSVKLSKADLSSNSFNYSLDVSDFATGAYIIDLSTDLGAIQTTLIKQN